MNRSQFLKRLGIGAAAVMVAPKIVAETKPKPIVIGLNEHKALRDKMAKTVANIPSGIIGIKCNHTPIDTILREWQKNNGRIIYRLP